MMNSGFVARSSMLDTIPESDSTIDFTTLAFQDNNRSSSSARIPASSSVAGISTKGVVEDSAVETAITTLNDIPRYIRCGIKIPWTTLLLLALLVGVIIIGVIFIVQNVHGPNENGTLFTNEPPSVAPSMHTSNYPTTIPSEYPSLVNSETPSFSPSTMRPSNDPTVTPTSSSMYPIDNALLDDLFVFLSGEALVVLPNTPQGQASRFIFNDSSVTIENDGLHRVIQRYCMCVLYFASAMFRSYNITNLHECAWPGVVCFNRTLVMGITWIHSPGGWSLPNEIMYLTNLTKLILYNTSLTGQLPESLWSLDSLTHLDISHNKLTGTISPQLLSLPNLESLFLDENNFTGSLPEEFSYWNSLAEFSVSKNNITGTIPESLWSLYSLRWLDFSQNRFEGTLSTLLWSLPYLTTLILSENALTGFIPEIPTTVAVPPPMTELFLFTNNLTGSLPESLSQLHKHLAIISIFGNQLTGNIPSNYSQLTLLRYLDLAHNKLNGEIPVLSDSLEYLYMNHNAFTGTIPEMLPEACINVWLHSNVLAGEIPSTFGVGLQNLTQIKIYNNTLKGHMPSALCDQDDLITSSSKLEVDCANNASRFYVSCDCCTMCY